MDRHIEFPEYEPDTGLRLIWEPGAAITVRRDGDATVVLANRSGWVTLARHALTIAQAGVPPGTHVHLDDSNGLEDDSVELIMELAE